MRRYLVLLFTLFIGTVLSTAEAKPQKMARYIYFDGTIVKKTPSGYGELILQRNTTDHANYHIEGTFEGNRISNAKLYVYPQLSEMKGEISGNFIYSIDSKTSTVILELNDVVLSKFEDKDISYEHVNLGKITMGRISWGMGFLNTNNITFTTTVDNDIFPSQLITLTGSKVCKARARITLSVAERRFFEVAKTTFTDDSWLFPNGAEYKCNTLLNDVYKTPEGDSILCNRLNTGKLSVEPNSRFIMKDQSIMTVKSWKILDVFWGDNTSKGNWDVEVKTSISFSSGAKYAGIIHMKQLGPIEVDGGWMITLVKNIKAMSETDVLFYEGIFTDINGNITKYIEGLTEIQYNKKKEEERIATEKAEKEKKEQELRKEQERQRYEKTHPLKHRRCTGCQGTGRCYTCNGKGWFIHPMNNEYMKCGFCAYSGRCPTCGGDGVEDYR